METREVLEAELPEKTNERNKAEKITRYFHMEGGLLMRRALVEQPDEQPEAQQDNEQQEEQGEQEEQENKKSITNKRNSKRIISQMLISHK